MIILSREPFVASKATKVSASEGLITVETHSTETIKGYLLICGSQCAKRTFLAWVFFIGK